MKSCLEHKHILLGVTGSIAAYKSCDLARELIRCGAKVTVLMTEAATRFVAPMTFEALTHNKVYVDPFACESSLQENKASSPNMAHIELTRRADLFCIAPATANCVAKLAHGLADDMISMTALVIRKPLVIAPAMNVHMWTHTTVQDNIAKLRSLGYHLVDPVEGDLACGDEGVGHLAEIETIVTAIEAVTCGQ